MRERCDESRKSVFYLQGLLEQVRVVVGDHTDRHERRAVVHGRQVKGRRLVLQNVVPDGPGLCIPPGVPVRIRT